MWTRLYLKLSLYFYLHLQLLFQYHWGFIFKGKCALQENNEYCTLKMKCIQMVIKPIIVQFIIYSKAWNVYFFYRCPFVRTVRIAANVSFNVSSHKSTVQDICIIEHPLRKCPVVKMRFRSASMLKIKQCTLKCCHCVLTSWPASA